MAVKQRTLGRTDLSCSEIGLGCWQLGGDWDPISDDFAEQILVSADSNNVTFWDTADVYGGGVSEKLVGAYNRDNPDSKRIIVTKAGRMPDLYPDGYTKEKLKAAIEASRERMQVNQLDLVQLHCIPFDVLKRGDVFDWLETFKADGLIRYYGASVETIAEAQFCLEHTNVASLQVIFNLLRQDMAEDVLPQAKQNGVGIIVRLGLASGLLSGKMTKDREFSAQDHRNYNKDGQMFNVGETFSGLPFETGLALAEQLYSVYGGAFTPVQLALRWLLDFDAVSTVITGASKPEQIATNAEVSQLPSLSDETHVLLRDFYRNQVRSHIRGEI